MRVTLLLASILVLFALVSPVIGQTCGGNCAGGKCKICYCGSDKIVQDIATWCAKFSWNQACCKCIASHESGGNLHSITLQENGSANVGLFGINNVYWGQCNDSKAPCDAQKSLNCAKDIYQWGGNTWKAWASRLGCGC